MSTDVSKADHRTWYCANAYRWSAQPDMAAIILHTTVKIRESNDTKTTAKNVTIVRIDRSQLATSYSRPMLVPVT